MNISHHLHKIPHRLLPRPSQIKTIFPSSVAFKEESLLEAGKGGKFNSDAEIFKSCLAFKQLKASYNPDQFLISNVENKARKELTYPIGFKLNEALSLLSIGSNIISEKPNGKEIVDPKSQLNIEINIPINNLNKGDVTLPSLNKTELIDPTDHVVEKEAKKGRSMLVIRHRKMKKHQRRKWRRKYKYQLHLLEEKRTLARKRKLEKDVKDKYVAAQNFDVDEHIIQKLQTAHWVPPLIHINELECPDWVIKKHLKEEERKNKISKRVEECLKMRNLHK